MKRRLCTMALALTLATAHAVVAGDLWLGVRGGPSLPQLSGGGDEITRDYSSIVTPNFGLVADYFLTKRWSLQVEAVYSVEGGERDGLQPITRTLPNMPANPLGPYYYADFDNKSILEYLEIPIMAKYQGEFSRHWRYFLEGGPYVGFLLSAEQRTRGYSQIYLDKNRTIPAIDPGTGQPVSANFHANTDVKDDLNTVNVGITAGVGLGYMLSDRQQIFLDIRGEYGFIPLQKDADKNGESHVGAIVFSLGYMLQLGD